MKQYRVCVVDEDLNQVTYWEWLDENGRASWPDKLVNKPVLVKNYLMHDTNTDAIGLCTIDTPILINKHNTIELTVALGTGWRSKRGITAPSD